MLRKVGAKYLAKKHLQGFLESVFICIDLIKISRVLSIRECKQKDQIVATGDDIGETIPLFSHAILTMALLGASFFRPTR